MLEVSLSVLSMHCVHVQCTLYTVHMAIPMGSATGKSWGGGAKKVGLSVRLECY